METAGVCVGSVVEPGTYLWSWGAHPVKQRGSDSDVYLDVYLDIYLGLGGSN